MISHLDSCPICGSRAITDDGMGNISCAGCSMTGVLREPVEMESSQRLQDKVDRLLEECKLWREQLVPHDIAIALRTWLFDPHRKRAELAFTAGFERQLAYILQDAGITQLIDASPAVRPRCEWNEDMGPKLWVRFPITEPPYVGSPLDLGQTVEVVTRYVGPSGDGETWRVVEETTRHYVGGWPGYHTHFMDIPMPVKGKEP